MPTFFSVHSLQVAGTVFRQNLILQVNSQTFPAPFRVPATRLEQVTSSFSEAGALHGQTSGRNGGRNCFTPMKKARKTGLFHYPQGESNPCSTAENRLSWATRRWGRWDNPLRCLHRCAGEDVILELLQGMSNKRIHDATAREL